MVYAITNDNRAEFPRELDTMYRDRKRIFVDRLKWNIPVIDDVYEMDQFDNDDTVYIVVADPQTGQHWASMRMIPSTKPHMLKDVFPSLCESDVPIGTDIWEMTRICLCPDLPRQPARESLGLAWLATVEFGLERGIRTITGLTHAMLISGLLAAGIDLEPLGPPKTFDGVQFSALQLRVDEEVLAREQKRLGLYRPVLRYHRAAVAA